MLGIPQLNKMNVIQDSSAAQVWREICPFINQKLQIVNY